MKTAAAVILGLLGAQVVCASACGQEPGQGPPTPCAGGQPDGSSCARPHGLHWVRACFPRCGCLDDYCPHPYPRPCPPPYPPFYRCVPAGNCQPTYSGPHTGGLAWWFIPTPRALREALWCQP
jgi:hypothetical protein